MNLIGLIPRLSPAVIFVENVMGFTGSRVHSYLKSQLSDCGYMVREFDLCPTAFGVPMRRPRHFLAALRSDRVFVELERLEPAAESLAEFLEPGFNPLLKVEDGVMAKYGQGFDIVDPLSSDAYLTCFTSGYWRCRKASGSLLALPDGGARRVSPDEILRLLGFGSDFVFPESLDFPARFRLAGNSVDVRAIRFLLGVVGYSQAAS